MRCSTFLLGLGLISFAAAAPLLEESVEEALEQSQAERDGANSWSKDFTNNRLIPKRGQGRPWASPGGVWTAKITHKTREKELSKNTDQEVAEIETISSLLRDIENSIPSSDRSDSDDDDTQASEENYNLVNRELVDDTDDHESFDDLTTDEAQVQKWKLFKSLLGKGLRVLKHKLRSRSRTPEEDRQAVNNPTKWKDLARNILGVAGDKLDPRTMEDASMEQTIEEAEIEKFKKIFKKIVKGVKKGVKIYKKIKPLLDTYNRRQPYQYAMVDSDTSIGVHGNYIEDRERELAEIEGFRSFLVNALRLVNSKLRPRSRTDEEDREAVKNPDKWTDLARNFLDTLREKLEQRRTGSSPGPEEPLTDEPPTDAASNVDQIWTTGEPDAMSQKRGLLFKLYRKLIRKLKSSRSG